MSDRLRRPSRNSDGEPQQTGATVSIGDGDRVGAARRTAALKRRTERKLDGDQAGDKAAEAHEQGRSEAADGDDSSDGDEEKPDPSTPQGAAAITEKLQADRTGAKKLLASLGAPGRSQLADSFKAEPPGAEILKLVFDLTPDGEVDTLGKILGARFKITVGPDTVKSDGKGIEWEASGLRRAWGVLEGLPPAHVEGNDKLWALVRYKVKKGGGSEGVFVEDGDRHQKVDQAAIGYDEKALDDDNSAFADKGDPLHDVNAFNATIRHEVGHAVDSKLAASDTYCKKADGGAWREYDDFEPVVKDMINSAGGTLGTVKDPAALDEITGCLAKVMKGQKFDAVEQQLGKGPLWRKLEKDTQKSVLLSPVVATIEKNTTANEPWMASPLTISGRCFQESYDKQWTSFAAEARDRKVSNYQFRAPGEWFAEAYAAYYEPAKDPAQKGAALAARDPKAKAYFDANVETATPDSDKGDKQGADGKTKKGKK